MIKHEYHSKPLDERGFANYSDEENKTWAFLRNRQMEIIKERAAKDYIKGVHALNLSDVVPQLPEVSKILHAHTGWSVAPVPAVIQPEEFFTLLANKKFPAANFIRIPEHIDYIEEPDVFHEIFGHCPLITNQAYSDFMFEYGKIALKAEPKIRGRLFRLFWFTVEFGLIQEDNKLKAYGGGILSSASETVYAVDSHVPVRVPLDAMEALRTPFRIDILQPKYFYIQKYDDLYNLLKNDLIAMAQESFVLGDHPRLFEKKPKIKEVYKDA